MKLMTLVALFSIQALATGGQSPSESCPSTQRIQLGCRVSGNALEYSRGDYAFALVSSSRSKDVAGRESLVCSYNAKEFKAYYRYKTQLELVKSEDGLRDLRDRFVADNPSYDVRVSRPVLRLSIVKGDAPKTRLNLGLGYFRESSNPQNFEANEVRVIYDQERFNAGMGDGYLAAHSCRLSSAPDSE